jgi:hypothetical protein
MKKHLVLLQVSVLFILSLPGQKIDTTACRMFESKLHVIENYFSHNISASETGDAIMILSSLTGIPPESGITYGGLRDPTIKDYYKWSKWYVINKMNIWWDDKLKVISIRRL